MSGPITPTRTYYTVFVALIVLTLATVAVSFVDLQPPALHTILGVSIGVVKAVLVGLFFMHLLHSSKASWLAVLAGLFWLGILMGLTLTDYLTRQFLEY